ncbi:MAG: antibiotic biosynthesis monooxygenase [Flavobacteriales bacterium]|nr:MAG: antibiotic biosynthesis monooxygenase [Flavobacteriales bacterium]
MIERIVIMTFLPERVQEFMDIFDSSSASIRQFSGCNGLRLLQNKEKLFQLTTYSLWESDLALENYRNSALFASTWAKTKVLFMEKPLAFSSVITREVIG